MPPRASSSPSAAAAAAAAALSAPDDEHDAGSLPTLEDVVMGFILPSAGAKCNGVLVLIIVLLVAARAGVYW
jgi:hypothetical protein